MYSVPQYTTMYIVTINCIHVSQNTAIHWNYKLCICVSGYKYVYWKYKLCTYILGYSYILELYIYSEHELQDTTLCIQCILGYSFIYWNYILCLVYPRIQLCILDICTMYMVSQDTATCWNYKLCICILGYNCILVKCSSLSLLDYPIEDQIQQRESFMNDNIIGSFQVK